MSELESSRRALERRLAALDPSEDVSSEIQTLREQLDKTNELVGLRLPELESSRDAVEHRLRQLEGSEGVADALQELRKQLEARSTASDLRASREARTQRRLVSISIITAVLLAFQGFQLARDVKQGERQIRAQEDDRRWVRRFEWLELIYPEGECPPDTVCGPVAHPRLRQEAVVRLAILTRQQNEDLDLSHADLSGLDLSGIDFSGADLESVDFSGSNLTEADFTSARLVNVELANATMVRAKLYGADLDRSVETLQFFLFVGPYDDLSQVLQRACGDSETRLPKGLRGLRPFEWLDRPIRPEDHRGAGCPNVIEPPL